MEHFLVEPVCRTESLPDLMLRVSEGNVTTLDLTTVKAQFASMSQSKKLQTLESIAHAPPALQCVRLDGLLLDNTHAQALANILQRRAMRELSVENNLLTEPGLLILAEALLKGSVAGGSLTALAVGNQRIVLSTLAITRLLDAMEQSKLTTLRLGSMRDDALRERHQKIAVDNNEAARLRRKAGASTVHPPNRRAVVGRPCSLDVELMTAHLTPITEMAAQAVGVAGRSFDGNACSSFAILEKPAPLCCLQPPVGWYTITFTSSTPQAVRVAFRAGSVELPPVFVKFEAE